MIRAPRRPSVILACIMALTAMAAHSASTSAADDLAVRYLERLSQTDQHDVVALASLADWAQANNLDLAAADVYRRILSIHPDDADAYQRLIHITDGVRLPEDHTRQQQVGDELFKELGIRFQLHVSQHFLIYYNTDKTWALNRAVLLEKTHDVFFSIFRRADLRPMPLNKRLVCVLFDSFDDFARYARSVDHIDMSWSSGFYSTRTNRIVFYNDRTSPAHQKVVAHIADLAKQMDTLRDKIREDRRNIALVSADRQELDRVSHEHQWYSNRLKGVAGMINTAKTTHEAVHQLAFNSGLQKRGVLYPFWLAEGLATNFETDDPAGHFGPYYDNPDRRRVLLQTFAANRLMPLHDFLAMTHPPVDDVKRVGEMYAEAYGLFQFLFKKRHDQMRKYLVKLAAVPPGMRTPDQLRSDFTDVFGPLRDIEDQFTTWLRLQR